MLKVITDNQIGYILSLFHLDNVKIEGAVGDAQPEISINHQYPADRIFEFSFDKDEDVPGDFASIDKSKSQWWISYVFNAEKGFLRKPWISIEIDGVDYTSTNILYSYISLEIGKDYIGRVKINNPDGAPGYDEFLDVIKLKDRNDFLAGDTRLEITHQPGVYEHTFPVRSNYPGISILRAKDNQVACDFTPLEIKFRQP